MKEWLYKWKWILSALICILLRYTLPATVIEKYYSLSIFRWIRFGLDNTFGKLPFPAYYLFILFLLLVFIKWILHWFTEKPDPILKHLFKTVSFFAFLTTFFFLLWGFNYGRVTLESKLNLTVQPLTDSIVIAEIDSTATKLLSIRQAFISDTNPIPQIIFINNIEENSRDAINQTLSTFGYPTSKVRGRFLLEDFFLIVGIGGQYLPFVGEGNVDDAIFYSKKPFYLIHEMTHGNGFGEEADCNFLAYIACVHSDKIPFQYSGELNYLIYLLANLKQTNKTEYQAAYERMPMEVKKDLETIKQYNLKHQFKTAELGDAINNFYLQMMGIPDGVKNYDKMLMLIYAWKQSHPVTQ